MYDISVTHNINTAPWEIDCTKRVLYLAKMIEKGYHISVIIYEYPDTSTFRYRGYNIYQAMKKSEKWKVVYFFRHELERVIPFLDQIDIVTVSRVKWNIPLQEFMNQVKQKNIPLMFDVDDRIYDLDYLPLVTNTLNVDFANYGERGYDFWFAQVSRIEMTARQADGYIGTNAFLGNTFQERFQKKSYIIPNFLNKEQVEISELCLAKKREQQSKHPFTIGYFSGTPSHINDFKIVYKEIMQLLYDYDNIFLKVVGFMEFPEEMQKLIKVGKIEFIPLVDFVRLQELEAQVDVNIVPLVTNNFTNCKSELKFFETAIVGTVTCATPSYTYRNAIQDKKTGFLCNPTEWYPTIRDIYEGKYNTAQIVADAREYALNQYFGENVVTQIENVYSNILNA